MEERTFIINYSWPLAYKGTYVVKAKDSFEAGNKVSEYLKCKYGRVDCANSVVIEVVNNQMVYI